MQEVICLLNSHEGFIIKILNHSYNIVANERGFTDFFAIGSMFIFAIILMIRSEILARMDMSVMNFYNFDMAIIVFCLISCLTEIGWQRQKYNKELEQFNRDKNI